MYVYHYYNYKASITSKSLETRAHGATKKKGLSNPEISMHREEIDEQAAGGGVGIVKKISN